MKKRGFTLIEIIVCIALISLIGVGSVFGVRIISKNITINKLEQIQDKILLATEVYIETNKETYNKLYKNKNGVMIPLNVLVNEGLLDVSGTKLDDRELKNNYVISMLTETPSTGECKDIKTVTSWNESSNEPLYICVDSLRDEIDALRAQINSFTSGGGGSDVKTNLKIESLYNDLTYTAKGADPKNYVYFEVNSDSSKFAYFPDTSNKSLWRIISIDTDGKIKLIYSESVKSKNSSNYNTESSPYCDESYYNLIHSTESSNCYQYNNEEGFLSTEIIEDVDVDGSKKKELFNSIVNNSWVISANYYPNYTMGSEGTNLTFQANNFIELKMGMINPKEINSSVNLSESWLYNVNTIIGVSETSHGSIFNKVGVNIYNNAGNQNWGMRYNKVEAGHYKLYGGSYHPVITLNENVELIEPTCNDGKVKGNMDCPYTLKCDEC